MSLIDDARPVKGGYDYDAFSELTGPLRQVSGDTPYQVEYVSLMRREKHRLRTVALTAAAFLVELVFFAWLMQPGHYPENTTGTTTYVLSMAMVVSIGIIELLRLTNVATLALATVVARDPIPVVPEAGLRIAFITTIVPGKEPLDMVQRTLQKAQTIRHDGQVDVWLLDEGNDPDVKGMCAEIGAHHFSRKGVERWNQPTGAHKAKTKHGNYNAWLEAHGDDYYAFVSVDPDHVPATNFAERLMGYFRDPDVAFVVGPQVYGNYDNFVTRAAESQQYLFHSVLQRAANAYESAMLVGTNNAMRISALRDIGGLQDSITEDAATSIVWHAKRNPATGRHWKSVYTPDVLAVGEGPSAWTDYFSQQHRWARGTNEVVLARFWREAWKLPVGRALHYGMLMSYYPSVAVAWVLGAINATLYLLFGVGGVQVAAQLWVMLYVDAAVLQLALYFWNRRHNISPHEEDGSSGIAGMFVSILSAPVYVTALIQAILRRDSSFVVTPKGDSQSPDRLLTFRTNLQWAALLVLGLVASVPLGNDHPAMRFWAVVSLTICLLPPAIWACTTQRNRHSEHTAASEPAHDDPTQWIDLTDPPVRLPALSGATAIRTWSAPAASFTHDNAHLENSR